MYLRFFFSIYPALIIAALAGVHRLLEQRRPSTRSGRPEPVEGRWYAETAVAALLIAATAAGFTDSQVQREILLDTRDMAAYAELGASAARTYIPRGSMVLADCGWANYLVYVGDFRPYDPNVFNAAWLAHRAGASDGAPGTANPAPPSVAPAVFNPLCATRFNEALGGKDQTQLTAALCDRLRQAAARHWPAMLLTKPENEIYWTQWLGPDWQLRRCNPPDQYWVAVYALVPSSATTLSAPPHAPAPATNLNTAPAAATTSRLSAPAAPASQ